MHPPAPGISLDHLTLFQHILTHKQLNRWFHFDPLKTPCVITGLRVMAKQVWETKLMPLKSGTSLIHYRVKNVLNRRNILMDIKVFACRGLLAYFCWLLPRLISSLQHVFKTVTATFLYVTLDHLELAFSVSLKINGGFQLQVCTERERERERIVKTLPQISYLHNVLYLYHVRDTSQTFHACSSQNSDQRVISLNSLSYPI